MGCSVIHWSHFQVEYITYKCDEVVLLYMCSFVSFSSSAHDLQSMVRSFCFTFYLRLIFKLRVLQRVMRSYCYTLVSFSNSVHDYQSAMMREGSGSVVECLTRDRRAAGSSLTGVTALWSLSKTHLS